MTALIVRASRLVGLALGLALCVLSARSAGAASLTDDRGVTVEIPATPTRIAAISFFATDLALALGVKPVATTYMYPGREPDFLLGIPKETKLIGQRAKPNLELLSETKPDIIIAMKRYTVGNAERFQKIAPYVAYNMELLSESYQEVADVSKILGKAEQGEKLNADFKRHLAEFGAKAPKDRHPSFVIMWGGDTPFAFHTENTAAAIVAAVGGDNIVGPMKQNGRFGIDLSLEALLAKNPDVIFIMEYGLERTHEGNPIWSQLSAVKNKRVYYVGDQWAETQGPIARELVLREAAHYLHPDVFPAVDVRAEAAKLISAATQN
ncbi:MAG: ferrichrome ABC transporter substrate-binding protein [Rhizobiales bacterium 65-9]|nr:ABC transporter substrate-binding protein [Hyphomicrobiales bacterium]OJY36089.1 MAG: ferrichrome ABC transporter substrate-binding protein [Rhizobiales bacterium 65-9]